MLGLLASSSSSSSSSSSLLAWLLLLALFVVARGMVVVAVGVGVGVVCVIVAELFPEPVKRKGSLGPCTEEKEREKGTKEVPPTPSLGAAGSNNQTASRDLRQPTTINALGVPSHNLLPFRAREPLLSGHGVFATSELKNASH
jgi:hypothetical protein